MMGRLFWVNQVTLGRNVITSYQSTSIQNKLVNPPLNSGLHNKQVEHDWNGLVKTQLSYKQYCTSCMYNMQISLHIYLWLHHRADRIDTYISLTLACLVENAITRHSICDKIRGTGINYSEGNPMTSCSLSPFTSLKRNIIVVLWLLSCPPLQLQHLLTCPRINYLFPLIDYFFVTLTFIELGTQE